MLTVLLPHWLQLADAGRRVHVVMPDQGEYDRAYRLFKSSLDVVGAGVTLGHLRELSGVSFSLEVRGATHQLLHHWSQHPPC
jgi:hypothetical protein